MSVYNVIIWSLNQWKIPFQMKNAGASVDGNYVFWLKEHKAVITPIKGLIVEVEMVIGASWSAHELETICINFNEPGSLQTLEHVIRGPR